MAIRRQLVGDIGGTNARFALLDESGAPSGPVTYRCDSEDGLVSAIRRFIGECGADVALDAAAIAVATPIIGDHVKLTNSSWSFSIREVQEDLDLDTLEVVNDFTALALSVPHLSMSETVQVGPGTAKPDQAIAVIGPGTGLGVSGMVRCGSTWVALRGEGGHVTLGGTTAREKEVHARLAMLWPHVSAERFLSGPGLVNIANALRNIDGLDPVSYTPADVSRLGIAEEDPVCVETLQHFCRLLGDCAGNLVLTLGAEGGCFIGGGIVPQLGKVFAESDFRAAFESKGRMRYYLEQIPTSVIHAKYPALTGAAHLLA